MVIAQGSFTVNQVFQNISSTDYSTRNVDLAKAAFENALQDVLNASIIVQNFVLSQVTANAAAGGTFTSFGSGAVAVNVACTVIFQYPIDSESNRIVLLNLFYRNITQQYSQSIQTGTFTQFLQKNAESQNVRVFTAAVATSIPEYGAPSVITISPTASPMVSPTVAPQASTSSEADPIFSAANAVNIFLVCLAIVLCIAVSGFGYLAYESSKLRSDIQWARQERVKDVPFVEKFQSDDNSKFLFAVDEAGRESALEHLQGASSDHYRMASPNAYGSPRYRINLDDTPENKI